jgi:hypothetical protein
MLLQQTPLKLKMFPLKYGWLKYSNCNKPLVLKLEHKTLPRQKKRGGDM